MKIIYETATGVVIRIAPEENPVLADGYALFDVPESVNPHTITLIHSDGQFETDAITATAKRWEIIRGHRTKLLRESDWICSITDYTVPDKDQWITYRQELRDITKQPDPFTVVWPKAPNE